MGATNGPYSWGQGPQPYGRMKRVKTNRKSSGKGCAVLAFLILSSPLVAGYSLWEMFS